MGEDGGVVVLGVGYRVVNTFGIFHAWHSLVSPLDHVAAAVAAGLALSPWWWRRSPYSAQVNCVSLYSSGIDSRVVLGI